MSRIPCRHYVLCEVASIFIILVSEFVVVVLLSEWWLGPTTAGTSLIHKIKLMFVTLPFHFIVLDLKLVSAIFIPLFQVKSENLKAIAQNMFY